MLYKLLKGHSPFRQHKTKDKHEIDRMTMTMNVELPNHFTMELRQLLEGLLQRDVVNRLGCKGRGAEEVKQHPFFNGIDWGLVYLQKYPVPLIPPRGEVNCKLIYFSNLLSIKNSKLIFFFQIQGLDAFDIGSFDEEDTKGIKLDQSDQDQYKDFSITVSERWQNEIADTVFDSVNQETDKIEQKKRTKLKFKIDDEKESDCIIHGYLKKLGGPFSISTNWTQRYCKLYPNRLELHSDTGKPELIFMDQIEEINQEKQQVKEYSCIVMKLKGDRESVKVTLGTSDEIAIKEWLCEICNTHKTSVELMSSLAKKASKIYGGNLSSLSSIQSVGGNFSNLTTNAFNGPNNLINNAFSSSSSPLLQSTNTLSSLTGAPSPISSHHSNLHQQSAQNNNLVLSPSIGPSHLLNHRH